MSLSLLSSKHTDAITVSRIGEGTYVKGNFKPGQVIDTDGILASIQPTPYNEQVKNEEGDRFKDQQTFFSTFQFIDNDKVTIDATGKKFLIMKLGDWSRYSLTPDHYEAIGISLDNQDE